MAWYTTGTISATNNSGAITGVGTLFMANVKVGDGVTIAGSTSIHEVVNVTSDTQFTVSPVYAGTTGSGKTYGIVPVQGYVKDLANQAKALILSFSTVGSSVSVNALAGITGIANTIPYFTASNTMVAKAVSSDAVNNTIAVRSSIGNLTATSLELGLPSGSSAPFIDFHSGSTYVDYDTRIISDLPTGVAAGGRMIYHANGGHLFYGATGIWEGGYKVYARNNIVGAVGGASGVTPTGAIIERGGNANGEYVRFADGTQMCWSGSVQIVSPSLAANVTTAVGINMPAPFVGAFNTWSTGWPHASWDYFGTLVSVMSSASAIQVMIRNGAYAQQFGMYFIAVGRWY